MSESIDKNWRETANIFFAGLILGICLAALIGGIIIAFSVIYFGIEVNFWNTALLSLVIGIISGQAVILRFLK